jgi:hypothetical protein
MPYVARASRTLPVSDTVAYDRLADHDSWPRWMPRSFSVIGTTKGTLTKGTKFRVRIEGVPFPVSLRVSVAERPAELTWCGGVRGLLYAEHRFLFERRGDREVEVSSVETWSGVLAALLRAAIEPQAEKVGAAQLAGLAKGTSSEP